MAQLALGAETCNPSTLKNFLSDDNQTKIVCGLKMKKNQFYHQTHLKLPVGGFAYGTPELRISTVKHI